MKLVVIILDDGGWVDDPEVNPTYIFNNMKDCWDYFNAIGCEVEIIKEPNPCNLYDLGRITLILNSCKYTFICSYGKEL
jgi:hypothetical protein